MPIYDKGPAGDTSRPPRSTCKICWRSIYLQQVTDWVVSPDPGLAHLACVEKQRAGSLTLSHSPS